MNTHSPARKKPWPLLIFVSLVVTVAATVGGLYFKARNDQIRKDLNMKPGESYQDLIDELGKKE